MALQTGAIATTGDATTLDMTGLLEHVRAARAAGWKPRHRSDEPHPLLVALVVLGGLMVVMAFWGLIIVLALSALL